MSDSFKQDLSRLPLQTILQVIGVGVVVANLYIASKLAPLAENLGRLETRVEATEEVLRERQELVNRFIVVEEKVNQINVTLGKIEVIQTKLESKIDTLLER